MSGLWYVEEDMRTSMARIVRLGDAGGVEWQDPLESPLRFLAWGEGGEVWGLNFDRGALWVTWRPSKAVWNQPHVERLHRPDPETLATVHTEELGGRVLAMA
jgi:hypothetical protein